MPSLTSAERVALQRAVSVHGRAWDVIVASGVCPGRDARTLTISLTLSVRSHGPVLITSIDQIRSCVSRSHSGMVATALPQDRSMNP